MKILIQMESRDDFSEAERVRMEMESRGFRDIVNKDIEIWCEYEG